MPPKKDDKGKKVKVKTEKKGGAKGKSEGEKKATMEKPPAEKTEIKDGFWHPPESNSPAVSPASETPAVSSESPASPFVTPSVTEVIPFYYEQRPLDLNLSASAFHQKIQEYGLSKVDIYLPSEEIPKELRRFKTLSPENLAAFERLMADKSPIVKKRILVILQYLYMVTSLV